MYKNRDKLNAILPEVIDTLMTSSKFTKNQLPEAVNWVKQMINYTIVGGKQGRGLAVPFAYEMMEDPKHFTKEKLHTARFLGMAIEMMQGFILAVDDIIDASTTRRGKPCWYLLPNVGTTAVNDCVLIYHCFMELIDIKFGKEPFYTDLVRHINEAVMYTTLGQYLDCALGYTKEKNNLDGFTMERFENIAIQKTGYYSFRLPVLAALYLVNNGKEKDTSEDSELTGICWEFGKLLQFQNDYKDVYWDANITGKAGTDIQEGKLSWIAVTALEHCNETQRAIFKEYYGSKDPEHVKRIKQLYDELQIVKIYENFQRSFYENLERRIRALPTEGETLFFLEVMEACRKEIY